MPSAASPSQLLAVAIWEAWCLHFGTLGDQFGVSGAAWRIIGAAGWTRGAGTGFQMISGQFGESALGIEA